MEQDTQHPEPAPDAKATEPITTEARKKENEEVAGWLIGLACSGLAWLFGKACEWLLPSEPGFWWKLVKVVYFTIVYAWMFGQLIYCGIQIYLIERQAGKPQQAAPPATEKPLEADDFPSGVLGWCMITAIRIVGLVVLLAIASFVLYGCYLILKSLGDQYLDLFVG